MIQELVGAALLGDSKFSFNGPPPHHHHHLFHTSSPSPTLSPSCPPPPPTTTTTTPTSNQPSSTSENQNNNNNNSLRCPRCDSPNTKFCYYNNYNLTQPRHFCKTCRRYWTKGGALRNVPIGGGCRKNKSTTPLLTASKSTAAKLLKTISPEMARPALDCDLPPNPFLWASSSPQTSQHLLAFLKSQNPNPTPTPTHLKEEKPTTRAMGSDQPPSLALSTNSMWRSNGQHQQPHAEHQNGVVLGDSGMQHLYQRLIRSSTNYFSDHQFHSHPQPSNAASSSSMLESAAVVSELGYAAFSWSDLSTTNINGAYP